ncbi:TPA: 54S ribosomal protein L13 [Trebouxia sp. C0005]
MSKVLKGVDTAGLKFRLVDAKEQVVGRLAAQLSVILQGKDKVQFAPHLDIGDVVVVKNAQHVVFTGKKWKQKLYRHHTGFPGGLKERSARLQFEKDPTEILRKAVYGMLPKNKLRDVCPAASKAVSLLTFLSAPALQGPRPQATYFS